MNTQANSNHDTSHDANTIGSDLSNTYSHAIVIGGSMAGLVAARVLSDHFDRVTVVERDVFPDGAEYRKGIPQAKHPHALLKRGEQILSSLFEGLVDELKDAGAVPLNLGSKFPWFVCNRWRPDYEPGLEAISSSRPLLETTVRKRLYNNPKISWIEEHDVSGLLSEAGSDNVTGVQLRSRANGQSATLLGNLVVDASGRDSRAPEWLREVGFSAPPETTITADPSYSTRIYEADLSLNWRGLYIQPSPAFGKRGAIILPLEGGRWHVTLIGMDGEVPPTDEAGYMEYAKSLPTSRLYDAIKEATPLTAPYGYRRGENRLRHYDKLEHGPANFVVIGDAAYAMDPVYGQGMSIACMGAMELDKCVRERRAAGQDLAGFAPDFQNHLRAAVDFPIQMAVGEDLRWSGARFEGVMAEPDPSAILMQNYLDQVMLATTYNPNVLEAFYNVAQLIESPAIFFRPDIVLQVAAVTGNLAVAQ